MIYTSYFAQCKKIPEKNLISIARKTPNFFRGKQCLVLAPSWDILIDYKSTLDQEVYVRRYYEEILKPLDPHKIVARLGKNPVLFCYEKPDDFCHRHLVADWLKASGYEVEEFLIS